MINTDYQMVDLLPEEEFGPFEGSMFIGGATSECNWSGLRPRPSVYLRIALVTPGGD